MAVHEPGNAQMSPTIPQRRDSPMFGPNRFKLGVFGLNCSGGLAATKVPERWRAGW